MKLTIAAAVTAALTVGLATAVPANADSTATVKAQTTQRMNGPSLNSGQDGVYNAGQVLTLVCHSNGEPVKGFFSFNEPNGGWDNLWYKTTDDHYVADVDIETHTLNAVGPDCGPTGGPAPASAPSGDRASQALAWARQQMATNPDSTDSCMKFVEDAYHTHWNYNTALDFFNALHQQGKTQTNTNIPAGALVFTSDPRFDQGDGHVMLSEGNGTYLTANYYTPPNAPGPKIREVPLNSNDANDKFLGWAYAP